jgi:sugar phosphate isomerase/epimerase
VNLSVITDEIDTRLDRALDVCEELGIDAVELRTVDGVPVAARDDVDAIRGELDRRGFRVSAVASPFLKCSRGEDQGDVYARALDAALILGAPVVRAFSWWREPDPAAVLPELGEDLRLAGAQARDAGVVLALENEHECNVATAAEARAALDAAASPDLWLIWDPGNAAMLDPGAFTGLGGLETVSGRVAHVHLKDVSAAGEWVRVGDGIVDFPGMVEHLSGYDGFFSFETHYQRGGSGERATRDCVAAFRELVA